MALALALNPQDIVPVSRQGGAVPAGVRNDPPLQDGWPKRLSVRRCEIQDAAGLWTLFNEDDYQRSGTLLGSFAGPDDVACWLAARRHGNFEIVGLDEGAVVGFAGLYPFQGRQSHAGWISLGVREAFQRRGYGRALLRALLATADHLARLSRVQLNVLVDNPRAIALYRSCDFAIEGRHTCFARRGSGYVDALTMARIKTDAFAGHI